MIWKAITVIATVVVSIGQYINLQRKTTVVLNTVSMVLALRDTKRAFPGIEELTKLKNLRPIDPESVDYKLYQYYHAEMMDPCDMDNIRPTSKVVSNFQDEAHPCDTVFVRCLPVGEKTKDFIAFREKSKDFTEVDNKKVCNPSEFSKEYRKNYNEKFHYFHDDRLLRNDIDNAMKAGVTGILTGLAIAAAPTAQEKLRRKIQELSDRRAGRVANS